MSDIKTHKREELRSCSDTYLIYYNILKCDGVLETRCNLKRRISKRSAVATYKRMIHNMTFCKIYRPLRDTGYTIRVFLISPKDEIIAFQDVEVIKYRVRA